MSKVTVIFVGGTSFVDKVIDGVSHGVHSHVAVKALGGVLEALGVKDEEDKYPGVWAHSADKYDNDPNAKFVEVDVPDVEAADKWAEGIISTPYAYVGCIDGGLHDMLGTNLPCDGQLTMNCSETVTRYLRAGKCDLLHGVYADAITPADDEKALEAV